jgi:AMMECR1 domain-containing protein
LTAATPPDLHPPTHPGAAGIVVAFEDPTSGARRSSTFLPEVARAERWDRGATLDAAVRKAGCSGAAAVGGIARASLRVTRYQSTTCTLGYDEYARMRSPGSEPRTTRGRLAMLLA